MPVTASSPINKATPRWKREVRILRRVGPIRWVRGYFLLRRFNKSVERMDTPRGQGAVRPQEKR